MAAVPAAILSLGALFLPETANSLIQRTDDTERAKLMLQRVRGTEDVEAELNDLIQANSTSKTNEHPFKNIIRRRYRPQLDNRTRRKRVPNLFSLSLLPFPSKEEKTRVDVIKLPKA
ncbi:hypothetical protein POTOM_016491 [Populus tomentosa]|uniref:Uncharacterized protein n=1 Tax=Populus tomentosa TaxID=118781 RepID=A0A8X8CY13_POPTO|nr:hypothetical protein POTOM_016491 [Populus tomentosa]